jgi:hypothetical protein
MYISIFYKVFNASLTLSSIFATQMLTPLKAVGCTLTGEGGVVIISLQHDIFFMIYLCLLICLVISR